MYSSMNHQLLNNVRQHVYVTVDIKRDRLDLEYTKHFPSLHSKEYHYQITVNPNRKACVHFNKIIHSLEEHYGLVFYDGPGMKSPQLIMSVTGTDNKTCFTAFQGMLVMVKGSLVITMFTVNQAKEIRYIKRKISFAFSFRS